MENITPTTEASNSYSSGLHLGFEEGIISALPSIPYSQASPVSTEANYCESCNKKFNSYESLKTHLQYHTENLINMWTNESRDDTSHSHTSHHQTCPNPASINVNTISELQDNPLSEADPNNRCQMSSLSHAQMPTTENVDYSNSNHGNVDSVHRSNGNQRFPTPTALSPMQFDFNQSPVMQSGAGTNVPPGPSSNHSTAGSYQAAQSPYYPEYTQLQTVSSAAQQSPGVNHSGVLVNHYGYQNGQVPVDLQAQPFEDYIGRNQISRFHPYTRSPQQSPSVKEEIKSEPSDILDLDANRYPSPDNYQPITLHSVGSMQQNIWRPVVDQQSSVNGGNMDSLTSTSSQNASVPVQHVTSNMYGGGTMLPQQPSPSPGGMNNLSLAYPLPSPSTTYHSQGYNPSSAVPNQSPNYLAPAPSPNPPSIVHHRPPGSEIPPSASELATNVKRPKNFHCQTCNKWFTSHGHLKRHYNTTLHRNMSKQEEAKKAAAISDSSLQIASESPSALGTQSSQITTSQTPTIISAVASPVPIRLIEPSVSTSTNMSIPTASELKPSFEYSGYRMPVDSVPLHTSSTTTNSNGTSIPSFATTSSAFPLPPYPASEYAQTHFPPIPMSHHQYPDSSHFGPNPEQSLSSSSSMYHGQFSSTNSSLHFNPTSSNNINSNAPAFFHTASTPMTGGGYLQQSGQNIQPVSPQQTVPGSYPNQGFPMQNDFPGQSNLESLENFKLEPNDDLPVISHSYYPAASDDTLPSSSPEGNRDSNSDESRDSVVTNGSAISGSSGEEQNKKYLCSHCPKTFSQMCHWSQHIKTKHNVEKNFKCETCGKKYIDQKTLDEHKAKHGGDKPYKCVECPKQFNHKTDLRRHSCLHTGEKPFSCEICQKGFIRKDHMVKHMTTHRKKQAATAHSASAANRIMNHPALPPLPPYPGPHTLPGHMTDRYPPAHPHMMHLHHPHVSMQQLPQHPNSVPPVY